MGHGPPSDDRQANRGAGSGVGTISARDEDAPPAVKAEGIGALLAGLTPKTVRCYRCGAATRASSKAMTTSCTNCFQRIDVQERVIKISSFGSELCTCGDVTITRRARSTTRVIVAGGRVRIFGEARGLILAGEAVEVGPGGVLLGGAVTPALELDPRARVEGGPFRVSFDPLGVLTSADEIKRLARGGELPSMDDLRAMAARLRTSGEPAESEAVTA